jgi:hypothetical protein
MRIILKTILSIILLSSYAINFKCGFEHFKHKFENPGKYSPPNSDNLRFLEEQPWESIRIHADYHNVDINTTLTDKQKQDIRDITNKTIRYYEKIIMVKRFKDLLIPNNCSGEIVKGPEISEGVNADLVIYVKWDEEAGDSTEGYAGACEASVSDGRPVTGLMAFTPMVKLSDSLTTNWLEYAVQFTLHEVGHILFMSSDYLKEVNPNYIIYKEINGIERKLAASPKVLEAAKKHFNCQDVDGVEYENQGGLGTAGEHWEARVMLGDFMVGEAYEEIAISEISLALMEDLGWYKTHKYTGGLFRFGKNKGCSFLKEKCIDSENEKSKLDEFCHTRDEEICTAGRHVKGVCMIDSSSQNLNQNMAYFRDKKLAGYTNADHCPLAQTYFTEDYLWYSSCRYGKTEKSFEKIGKLSSCFITDIHNQNSGSGASQYAVCYEFACDFTNEIIKVKLGVDTVECPRAGGTIMFESDSFRGRLACPDYNLICTSNPACNDVFDCIDEKAEPLNSTFTYDYDIVNSNEFTTANDKIDNDNEKVETETEKEKVETETEKEKVETETEEEKVEEEKVEDDDKKIEEEKVEDNDKKIEKEKVTDDDKNNESAIDINKKEETKIDTNNDNSLSSRFLSISYFVIVFLYISIIN